MSDRRVHTLHLISVHSHHGPGGQAGERPSAVTARTLYMAPVGLVVPPGVELIHCYYNHIILCTDLCVK